MTDAVTLQARLEEALAAEHALATGAQVEQVTAADGRSVRYTRPDLPALRVYIQDLKRQLGTSPRRRALGVYFG